MDEHLGPFQYFAIINKAAGNVFLHRSFRLCERKSVGWISRSEIAGSKGVGSLHLDCFQWGVWGMTCPSSSPACCHQSGPLSNPNKTKESLTHSTSAKAFFIHVGFLQRRVPGQRNNSELLLSPVQTAEPGSRGACSRPSIISLLPLPGLWNKGLGACLLLVWTGLNSSCWREKDSKWTLASVALNPDSQQAGGPGEGEGNRRQGGSRFSCPRLRPGP